jgi:TonB family protein
VWSRDNTETIALPANLAPEFVETAQRCLDRDPGRRPTIAELAAQFKPAPPATPQTVAPPPVLNEPLVTTLSTSHSPKTRLLVTAITLGIVSLWLIWTGAHLIHSRAAVQQPAVPAPQAPPVVSPPAAVENPKASAAAALPAILHQEMPEISRSARESIRGVIKVGVRAAVDRSGNVVGTALDSRSSSKYFARAATEAAKKWKFAPAPEQASRVWLLQFDFTRAGTIGHAAAVR